MAKLIMFSNPQPVVMETIAPHLFPHVGVTLGYMPADGSSPSNLKYQRFWDDYCKRHQAKLLSINISLRGNEADLEIKKVNSVDSLIITGGNTFHLLYNLKESGLLEAVRRFGKRKNAVLAGFSAGAIVMSPTIDICYADDMDENLVGIKDLTALNLVDFEIFPHYEHTANYDDVKKYREKTDLEVKTIADDEVIIIG